MTRTILILGASGKFGRAVASEFTAGGWRVREYDRSTGNMVKAAMGADVIFNGLNPPNYHDWAGIIPAITQDVLSAARASGATIVIPGNVYVFGDTPSIWDENTPHRASTRKGRIRIAMEDAYKNASRTEGVRVINLRAGDIIAPDAPDTALSRVTLGKLARGRFVHMGRPNARHAWCYTPDYARAVFALVEMRDVLRPYEDISFPGLALSGEEMKARYETLVGHSLKSESFPWWLLSLASPVWELAREMREMRPLWNVSHELSGAKLSGLLPGFQMTPIDKVLASALPVDIHPDQPVVRPDAAVGAH